MFEIDDDDFIPASSSNLSSLFNSNNISSEDFSSGLTYRAPKQPKSKEDANLHVSEKDKIESSVLLTKVVTLWKLEGGNNRLMGKHIVAIIGNPSQNIFEIIIYQEKANIVIKQTLNESVTFYKYPKNFVALYDIQNRFWNLNFDGPHNLEQFLNEVQKFKCQIIDKNADVIFNKDQVDTNTNTEKYGERSELKKNEITSDEQFSFDNREQKRKANVLSRITKMGHPFLPKSELERKISSELSDSDTESSFSDTRPNKPMTAPRKFNRCHNQYQERVVVSSRVTEDNAMIPILTSNGQMTSNNNQMMLNPQGVAYSQPFPGYGLNNFIIAQNAEMKANLTEINIKLNSVLNSRSALLDKNGNNEECDVLKSRIKCLNLKIENLSLDLEKSRGQYKELEKKYEEKCIQILEEKQKNENIGILESELKLSREMLQNVKILTEDIEKLKTDLKQKEKLIETQSLKLTDFEKYYEENENVKAEFSKDIDTLNAKIKEMDLEIKYQEDKLREKEYELEICSKEKVAGDKDRVDRVVKESMNEAFRCMMESFDEDVKYSFKEIQEVILKNLKKTTFSLIEDLK